MIRSKRGVGGVITATRAGLASPPDNDRNNFFGDDDAAFIARCFLDIERLMRLLGCWLTHDRLVVVQACYTLLAKEVGRRDTVGGGGVDSKSRSSGGNLLGITIPALASPADVGRKTVVTLSDLMHRVVITKHPDVASNVVKLADGVTRFYHLWGLSGPAEDHVLKDGGEFGTLLHNKVAVSSSFQRATNWGRGGSEMVRSSAAIGGGGAAAAFTTAMAFSQAPVSMELFCQFHADLLVSYPAPTSAAGAGGGGGAVLLPADHSVLTFIANLWGFTLEQMRAVPTPAPPLTRSATDAIFESIDHNKNNILSLAEMDGAIVTRFPQYNYKPLIMRAYRLADKNKSGLISRQEFHHFIVYLAHLKHFADLFQKIDVDQSRSLSLEELVNAKSLLELGDAPNSRLRALFLEIDKNRQGKILFDEFCACLLKHYPPPEL